MTISRWAGAAPIFLLASCTHQAQEINAAARRPSAVQTVMQRQIQNAVDAGDGDVIARQLRDQMTAHPENLTFRLQLADHYRRLGSLELAIEHYRLAADRFPDDPKVTLLLAQAMQDQKMTADSAALLEKFLAKHPASGADLPAWLGILRDQLGDYSSGESAHRAAIAQSPSNAKLHNNLGYNLLLQGKRTEAVGQFRRALALDPKMETANNNLGMALMKGAGPKEREEVLARWQSSTDSATAHNNIAAILIEQGNYAEARKELEAALHARRTFTPALKNLELVSRLDRKPAAVPPEDKVTGWTHAFKHFWNAVAGIDEKPHSTAVTVATRE